MLFDFMPRARRNYAALVMARNGIGHNSIRGAGASGGRPRWPYSGACWIFAWVALSDVVAERRDAGSRGFQPTVIAPILFASRPRVKTRGYPQSLAPRGRESQGVKFVSARRIFARVFGDESAA